MKSAKELTCLLFKDNIRVFIDDEFPVNQKSSFLEHAEKCNDCNKDLLTMQRIKKELANFKPLKVSPEFDFRIKSSIRREYDLLRNPYYSFKIFIQENAAKLLFVPASVVILIFSVMLYNSNTEQNSPILPAEITSLIDAREGVDLTSNQDNSRIEEVNYVLETVKSTDADRGIFHVNPDGTFTTSMTDNNVTLISF